jgi:hypothetical protein
MSRVIYPAIYAAIALLTLCCSSQVRNERSDDDSCHKFVQGFYDWYIRHSGKDGMVINERPELFAPELLTLLKQNENFEAPELDLAFDASYFTLTQENADSYIAGTPKRINETYNVPLYGIRAGVKSGEPEFWAEVKRSQRGWQFINFHDNIEGKPFNLVNDLRRLQVERARAIKQ